MAAHRQAYGRAEAYLRALAGGHCAGQRLAPIHELAAEAGVSVVTMWKAVRALTEEGVLAAAPRKGITVTGTQPSSHSVSRSPVSGESTVRWRSLCRELQRDLLNGGLSRTTDIPSIKALCDRYGVCHHTVRKALRRLTDHGWVERRGRQYRVCSPDAPRNRNRVVLVARGDKHSGEVRLLSPRTEVILKTLEQECLQAELELETITCDATASRFLPEDTWRELHQLRHRGQPSVLGFLVITTNMDPGSALDTIARSIRRFDAPAAILDEDNRCRPGALPPGRSRIFSLASDKAAGREMGRLLLRQGHRSVAFVSVAHEERWSRQRLEGLREALADSATAAQLTPATITLKWRAFFDLPPTADHRSHVALMRAAVTGHSSAHEQTIARAALQAIDAYDTYNTQLRIADKLRPLLDRLISRRDISAWVAANDIMALHCLDYLRRHRVDTSVSIVGFDNTPAAADRKVSSYDFNTVASVKNAIRFLLAPSAPQFRAPRHRVIATDGKVVVRGSMRR